jgi:phosphatidate cytidylyltransferase
MPGASGALVRALLEPGREVFSPPTPSRSWGDLRLRALSAVVLAPLALLCVWRGGLAWQILMGLAVLGLAVEWLQMSRRPGRAWPAWAAGGGVLVLCAAGAAMIWLRADAAAGRANVLGVVLAVWATDIGAYLAGRLLGGPKLAPAISPGKTWSGAIGGLLAAVAVGLLFVRLLGGAAGLRAALVLGGLSLVSQGGDLLESALKRHFGVKDSGHLIPGHGGLLDRLDGMLAAAPAAACLALYLGPGVPLWQ